MCKALHINLLPLEGNLRSVDGIELNAKENLPNVDDECVNKRQ